MKKMKLDQYSNNKQTMSDTFKELTENIEILNKKMEIKYKF